MEYLAERLSSLKPSPTLSISQKAKRLKAEGHEIIDLSVGEPDFDTPDHIKEATHLALVKGETKYTPVDGILPLKKAIQSKFLSENNITYELDEILVSNGAKHSLFNALFASINPTDEVIIPAPYWVSYLDMVSLCGGKNVVVPCPESQRFKISARQLEHKITTRTKWLILNSPSNPTGEVYSKEELYALLDVVRKHPNLLLLSDEIYEDLIHGEEKSYSPASLAPDLKDRIVTVNGVSKTYSMTGFRIGYAAGPKKLISAMKDLQSHTTSNPCSLSQFAALKAIESPKTFLKAWRSAYKERRDFLVNAINNINGLSCLNPDGAFYVFMNCSDLIGTQFPDDTAIANYLLEKGIAGVPGSAFGLSPYIRFSYATSKENLKKAIDILQNCFGNQK